MNIKPSQGEIWIVRLDPVIGHEQARTRPCLVVSHNFLNHGAAGLAFVIPLTSRDKEIPYYVTIKPPEGGLLKISYVMIDQLRVVSFLRFSQEPLGEVSVQTLRAVQKSLCDVLGL